MQRDDPGRARFRLTGLPIVFGVIEEGRGRRRRIARRTLHSPATVEAYLQAGVMPRFIERLREIEDEIVRQRMLVERSYEWMRRKYRDRPDEFAERWRAMAANWGFDALNEVIAQHNEWYPVERRLPLDPRTGRYLTVGGRDWRRKPLDADWILGQFPAASARRSSSPGSSTGSSAATMSSSNPAGASGVTT